MPFIHAAAMFIAAFLAGIVNSIAGGGTLLTFPLLIWLGLDPKVANATSTVALWPGLFGGLFGYRREMNDSSLILMRLGVISLIGGGVGAWLLIATGSVSDSVRNPSVHESGAGESLAASAHRRRRINESLVEFCDSGPVFFGGVRRLFRSRQRHLDAGGDGTVGHARYTSRQRHQEFSGRLH
jgi:hypothetical protein